MTQASQTEAVHDQSQRSEQRAAQAEWRRARRRLESLQSVLMGGGVVFALATVLLGSWWWRTSTHGWGGSWVTLLLGIFSATTALQGAAFFLALAYSRRHPLPAASLVATLASGATALAFLVTHASPPTLWTRLSLFVPLAVTILLWGLVAWASRFRSLEREHPDLFERRSQRRPSIPVAPRLAALVLGVFGVFVLGALALQESPREAARRFESAWNSGDREALAAMVDQGVEGRERYLRWLDREFGGEALPQVEYSELLESRVGQPMTQFHSPGVILRVSWHMPSPVGPWLVLNVKQR